MVPFLHLLLDASPLTDVRAKVSLLVREHLKLRFEHRLVLLVLNFACVWIKVLQDSHDSRHNLRVS